MKKIKNKVFPTIALPNEIWEQALVPSFVREGLGEVLTNAKNI